jgi:hypothetical protein
VKISLRPVLIGLILLVGVLSLVRIVPATQVVEKAKLGACNIENPGVTLVIDFGSESKKPPLIKCAANFNLASNAVSNELNGWQVFQATGVSVEGTADIAVGFACRIAGYPSKSSQSCDKTPSYAEGHWAYFYAQNKPKKGWQFSGTGSLNRKPACGSAEGWLFVKGEDSTGSESKVLPSVTPEAFSCQP